MKKFLVSAGVVVGLAVAWWLGSPLFIDKTVDEPSPTSVVEIGETNLEEQIAPEDREKHEEMMKTVDPEVMVMEKMEKVEEPSVIKQGSFVAVGHEGTGDAKIYRVHGETFLRLENLRVLNGPDLRVLLSPNAQVKNSSDLGEYVELDTLKGNIGNQNYAIDSAVDIDAYKSVVIYCKPFHVVFNVADLK